MTGRARDLLRGVRRLGQEVVGRALPQRAEIDVEIAVPDGSPIAGLSILERSLGQLLDRRVKELGIGRDLLLRIGSALEAGLIEVSVDGRPAACVVAAPGADASQAPADWAALVVRRIDRAMRRRLSLFLDDQEHRRFTVQVAAATGLGPEDGRSEMSPGYLLDHGLSLKSLENLQLPAGALTGREGDFEVAEVLLDAISPRTVSVELGQATLRRASEESRSDLVRAREELYESLGMVFPEVEIAFTDAPPDVARITVADVRLPDIRLGEAAGWRGVVVALRGELASQAHWFLRAQDVDRARRGLGQAAPSLARLSETFYSAPLLTACLRCVVRGGDSMRNLPRLLWLLLEAGSGRPGPDTVRFAEAPIASSGSRVDVSRDADLLASGLRKRIAAESWRVGAGQEPVRLLRLSPELEAALVAPGEAEQRAIAEWEAVRRVMAQIAAGTATSLIPGSGASSRSRSSRDPRMGCARFATRSRRFRLRPGW